MSNEVKFGLDDIPKSKKTDKVSEIFTSVAEKYDLMNDVMSVGAHRYWKECMIDWLDPFVGMKIIDVAGGTGDISSRFLKRIDGQGEAIYSNGNRYVGNWKNGIIDGQKRGLPISWSEEKNVTWKTKIEGKAWSSPVIWKDQIWLTNSSANGKSMDAICINTNDGKIAYNLNLFKNETVEPLGNNVNSYGSPSPVIEEGMVYIHFGSYGTAAINTTNGKESWRRTDLKCRHFRGPGSSPILYEDLLILTMDGIDYQYIIALDKKTGATKWKTERSTKWDDVEPNGKIRGDGDLRKAYTTPTFTKVSGKIIMISPGAKSCFAYDPSTGKELWNITYSGYSNASRTVLYNCLLYTSDAADE